MSASVRPVTPPRDYASAPIHETPRALHRSRIDVWNPGWLVVAAAAVLSILGIVTIQTAAPGQAARQAAHLCIGVLAAALVTLPHPHWIRRTSPVAVVVIIAMLIFVLLPFVPESIVRPRNGARRWITLFGFDIQPSELAKIVYVMVIASYLRYRRNHRRLTGLLMPFALTFVPMALIAREPDLGTALLFLPVLFVMLAAAGARMRHLVLIGVLGIASAPLAYPFLQPHQKSRVQALYFQVRGDDRYVRTIGYQGNTAMMLAGSGGLTGVGADASADLVRFNHLPEQHNDMIFAVITCRFGLLGALALWTLFMVIVAGGMLVAAQCKDPFGRLLVIGLTVMIFVQMLVNTGMTIGLLFITGLNLPFVSYGGSSLIAAWLMVGMMLNVGLRRPQYMERESFSFDDD